jgi:two-component system response regulator RegA
VDEESSIRDLLAKHFREKGYEVATAENATEAIFHLAQQPCDVALVDIRMRGTTGEVELHRQMREVDAKLMVILMTSYESAGAAVTELNNGAYYFVTKPPNPDEIAHLVKNALAHKSTLHENVLLRETIANLHKMVPFKPRDPANGSSKTLADIERVHILRVVEECGGNQSHAAEVLDIDRVTLYHKLKKYGWSRTPSRSDSARSDSAKTGSSKTESSRSSALNSD